MTGSNFSHDGVDELGRTLVGVIMSSAVLCYGGLVLAWLLPAATHLLGAPEFLAHVGWYAAWLPLGLAGASAIQYFRLGSVLLCLLAVGAMEFAFPGSYQATIEYWSW